VSFEVGQRVRVVQLLNRLFSGYIGQEGVVVFVSDIGVPYHVSFEHLHRSCDFRAEELELV
jgi:hypothetical protein